MENPYRRRRLISFAVVLFAAALIGSLVDQEAVRQLLLALLVIPAIMIWFVSGLVSIALCLASVAKVGYAWLGIKEDNKAVTVADIFGSFQLLRFFTSLTFVSEIIMGIGLLFLVNARVNSPLFIIPLQVTSLTWAISALVIWRMRRIYPEDSLAPSKETEKPKNDDPSVYLLNTPGILSEPLDPDGEIPAALAARLGLKE